MLYSGLKLTSHKKIITILKHQYWHRNTFHPFIWAAWLIPVKLLKLCNNNLALITGEQLFFMYKPFTKKNWEM